MATPDPYHPVYSFAFANLFADPSVTAILTTTFTSAPVGKRIITSELQIVDQYFHGREPVAQTSVFRDAYNLLMSGARKSLEHGQKAFLIGITADDPIHAMNPYDARRAAITLLMQKAREDFMAGTPEIVLSTKVNDKPAMMSQMRLLGNNKMEQFPIVTFRSHKLAAILAEMDAQALDYTILQRPMEIMEELDKHVASVEARTKYEIGKIMKGFGLETARKHIALDNNVPFDTLWARACSETRDSKLDSLVLDELEYGRDVVEANGGGIPQNTEITYIGSDVLNGVVNIGRNHICMMIARYGLDDGGENYSRHAYFERVIDECRLADNYDPVRRVRDEYQAHADSITKNLHGDDWLVAFETSDSFFSMWYDNDVSDCCIARYSKEDLKELGVESITDFLYELLIRHSKSSATYFSQYTGLDEHIIVRSAARLNWIHF